MSVVIKLVLYSRASTTEYSLLISGKSNMSEVTYCFRNGLSNWSSSFCRLSGFRSFLALSAFESHLSRYLGGGADHFEGSSIANQPFRKRRQLMCDRLQFTCTILYGILTLVGEFMAKMTWLVLQLVGAMGHMCVKICLCGWMQQESYAAQNDVRT